MSGQQNLNRTIRKSIIGSVITGSAAAVGGIVGGPIGLGVGGAVGGLISSAILGFNSAPSVIQNQFTPNERQELLERVRLNMGEVKELVVNILLQILSQLRDCRTSISNDFKCRVLLPLLESLIGLGVGRLIREIFAAMAG